MSQETSNNKAADGKSQNSQIIGKTMWLITKADVRYEGILYEVDRVNKTMSLKQVKNMGTEGRRNGQNELQPDDKVLGNVKFRVDLIKKFQIIENEQENSNNEEPEMDPAIVQQEVQQETKNSAETSAGPNLNQGEEKDEWQKGTQMKK